MSLTVGPVNDMHNLTEAIKKLTKVIEDLNVSIDVLDTTLEDIKEIAGDD